MVSVLMLAWEFPPRIVGGIAQHVYNLSRALTRSGIEVFVATCDFPNTPSREEVEGVHVLRVDAYSIPSPDFPSWVYLMNLNMVNEVAPMIREKGIDLLHAHDWLVALAGIGLKSMLRVPLVTTMHSTEEGRRNGLHSDYQRMIHQTEWWLTYES